MKNFLLGVGATLAVLLVAAVAGLLALGGGATPLPQTSSSSVLGDTPAVPVEAPGDLGADETWLSAVQLRSESVVSPDADLVDVSTTGAGVRFSEKGLRATRLDIDATIPFDTVAEQVGEGVRLYAAGSGRAGVEREVSVLGRDLTVRATGTVLADRGQISVEPETVDVGGPALVNDAVSAVARSLVTIRQDVPGVPDGMRLTGVEVTDVGFRAQLTGTDVTIAPTNG